MCGGSEGGPDVGNDDGVDDGGVWFPGGKEWRFKGDS